MFKLESYITPFIMGYIDKYVKLKQEDFQLSLWGGDAVLNKLDLRLEAIEDALQLPITVKSGHIHELRIHVPWTKLGSEPVVVTINTIECILKLQDSAAESRSTSSSSSAQKTSQQKVKVRKPADQEEDLPPGYLQGYINKIIDNVNIVINNLILKFVEDDIVLSINVKSAEMFSTNQNWDRDFVEVSQPELILRRAVNFHDLTVCLDKRNASGKIESYQDPLLYRCSLSCRWLMIYDALHAKYPAVTKFNILCEKLQLSLTDVQLPMFFRLIELCLAVYYGDVDLAANTEENTQASEVRGHIHRNDRAGDEMSDSDRQGWSAWAWSYVPQILPEDEQDDYDWLHPSENGDKRQKSRQAAVFCLGMYCKQACVSFKVTELREDRSHYHDYRPQKISFQPCMRWDVHGIGVEVLMKGLEFFNIQIGITSSLVFSEGQAICGVKDIEKSTRDPCFFRSGQIADDGSLNFLSYSLFDPDSAENQGDRAEFITDWDRHMEIFTEAYGIRKFGTVFIDYCYVMEKMADSQQADDNDSDNSEGQIAGAKENSNMRFVIGPSHLVVSSSMVQRIHKFIFSATNHHYEPYAKPRNDMPPLNRSPPSDEMVNKLENYIPTRTYHFTLLRPSVLIQANDLPQYDVTKNRVISHRKAHKHKPADWVLPHGPIPPLPGFLLQADRFDVQLTSAMFPKKLVTYVSAMTAPSGNLLHHCRKHTYVKLFGFQAGLTYINEKNQMTSLQNLVKPCSVAIYQSTLMLPKYWNNPLQTRREMMYEIPGIALSASSAQGMLAWYIVSTWLQPQPDPRLILDTSLITDVFFPQLRGVSQPVLEGVLSNIEIKQCYTDSTTSMTATLR